MPKKRKKVCYECLEPLDGFGNLCELCKQRIEEEEALYDDELKHSQDDMDSWDDE